MRVAVSVLVLLVAVVVVRMVVLEFIVAFVVVILVVIPMVWVYCLTFSTGKGEYLHEYESGPESEYK